MVRRVCRETRPLKVAAIYSTLGQKRSKTQAKQQVMTSNVQKH